MVLQKLKIYVILNLEFIKLGTFLQMIYVHILIILNWLY